MFDVSNLRAAPAVCVCQVSQSLLQLAALCFGTAAVGVGRRQPKPGLDITNWYQRWVAVRFTVVDVSGIQ
jgi:hypothetical protein